MFRISTGSTSFTVHVEAAARLVNPTANHRRQQQRLRPGRLSQGHAGRQTTATARVNRSPWHAAGTAPHRRRDQGIGNVGWVTGRPQDAKSLKPALNMEAAVHTRRSGRGFDSRHLHQSVFSKVRSGPKIGPSLTRRTRSSIGENRMSPTPSGGEGGILEPGQAESMPCSGVSTLLTSSRRGHYPLWWRSCLGTTSRVREVGLSTDSISMP